MNGSFVIPAKYIKNYSTAKTWLFHSIIGLSIIPWIILSFISPGIIHNYWLLDSPTLILLILGGILFGIGQVCFAYAIETIGVGLSFAINLGIAVTIGSLFVAFYKSAIFSLKNYFVVLAVFLIVISLVCNYFSSKKYDQPHLNKHYHRGWLLAAIAGLASGFQNIIFVIIAFHTKTEFQTINSFWVWPPFLLAAAVPMIIGFAYRIKRFSPQNPTHTLSAIFNFFLIAMMGLFFTGSLALYSGGMTQLTSAHQAIGWPVFMVMIILTSQSWSWFFGETKNIVLKQKFHKLISIGLLIASILILAFDI